MANILLREKLRNCRSNALHLLISDFHSKDDLTGAEEVLSKMEGEKLRLEEQKNELRASILLKSAEAIEKSQFALSQWVELESRIRNSFVSSSGDASLDAINELSALAFKAQRIEKMKRYVSVWMKLEGLIADFEDSVSHIKDNTAPDWNSLLSSSKHFFEASTKLKTLSLTHPTWEKLFFAARDRLDSLGQPVKNKITSLYQTILEDSGWPESIFFPSRATKAKSRKLLESKIAPETENQTQKKAGDFPANFEEAFVAATVFDTADSGKYGSEDLSGIREIVSRFSTFADPLWSSWLDRPDLTLALVLRGCLTLLDLFDHSQIQSNLDAIEGMAHVRVREQLIQAFSDMAGGKFREVSDSLAESIRNERGESNTSLLLFTMDQLLRFDRKMAQLFSIDGERDEEVSSSLLGLRAAASFLSDDACRAWFDAELQRAQGRVSTAFSKETPWKIPEVKEAGQTDVVGFPAAEILLDEMWLLVERCRDLDEASRRLSFVRRAIAPLAASFVDDLENRSNQIFAQSSLADVESIAVEFCLVATAIQVQTALEEWCDTAFFVELVGTSDRSKVSETRVEGDADGWEIEGVLEAENSAILEPWSSVFDPELKPFKDFVSAGLGKAVDAFERGIEPLVSAYFSSSDTRKGYTAEYESLGEVEVSPALFPVLDFLGVRFDAAMRFLSGETLDGVWKRVAKNLDRRMFESFVAANVKVTESGIPQVTADVSAILAPFARFVPKPDAYFRRLRDLNRLFELSLGDSLKLFSALSLELQSNSLDEGKLKAILSDKGVKCLPSKQVLQVLSHRSSLKRSYP